MTTFTETHILDLGLGTIRITVERDTQDDGIFATSLESDLCTGDADEADFDRAIDGVESLILGHLIAGVDITQESYVWGIRSTIDVLANEYL